MYERSGAWLDRTDRARVEGEVLARKGPLLHEKRKQVIPSWLSIDLSIVLSFFLSLSLSLSFYIYYIYVYVYTYTYIYIYTCIHT